jgi:molybdenum-dependent DNA-binding transcriptional regulator ModE
MNREQKVIRGKIGLLELAKQLGNISQACRMMGLFAPHASILVT